MASKCRNIWDTLRGDVATTCGPTLSCYPDAVAAGPSSCQPELQPLGSNSSRRNCDVRGEKTDQKCQHDALKTSELSCWSRNTGPGRSAVLETACLFHQQGESSTVNLTASNSAKTVLAVPRLISTSKTPLRASRDVTCNDNFVQSSRLSVRCRDTSVTVSLSTKTGCVSERHSVNQPKALQKRAVVFPGETNSHSEPSSLLKVSSACSVDVKAVQERRKQSDARGGSVVRKAKYSQTKSRGRATESFSNNCSSDFGSVDADLGHGVDKVLDALSFLDHLPVPDVVLSTAQSKHCTAQTKSKQTTIRNDHDTNSAADRNSLTDAVQRGQMATSILGSGYSLNNFKCQSPDADIEMENLSDAGEIPLFSSPFDAVTVNYNSGTDSSLSVYCGSSLAKMSHPEDVRSGICDLVSSVNGSNISLSHISRTSISDISENELGSSVTNGVILAKELGYAEGKAVQKGVNDGTYLKDSEGACDDAEVDAYVVMLRDNAYSKLQYFYTSSKNSNNLSFPVSKSDSEAFPDCCDEGFVESPMTTDDTMESMNDIDGDRSSQMPTTVSDNNVYESTRMLTNDETDTEFTSDEIQIAVEGVLGRLEADTLWETNVSLETNIIQEMNVRPKSDEERLIEPLTSKFRDHDYSKSDSECVERNPMSKSENVVEVCANDDSMEINQSSHIATGGDVTSSKDSKVSRVSDVCFNSVHNFGNDTFSKGNGVSESVGVDHEIGVAKLDDCQTHLANTTKTGVSQCNAETTSHPLDISQTNSFNEAKHLSGISSKLLPASSELSTALCFGDGRVSENAVSPSTFISGSSECLPSTSTLLLQDRLCPSMNVTDRSNDSVQSLDDSCIARKNCNTFKTEKADDILSSDFKTNNDLVRGNECDIGHSSSESSWGDKAYDTFSETSRSRSEYEPADCKTENFGAFANKSQKKTSRQPRMLNEIANTVGFIADKRQSQHSDSLFIDSKLLTREERVLQMVHMQITKMEVKEELTKLKKTKSLSETTDQDNKSERVEPAPDRRFPITHHHVQRRIKASVGRTSKCHQLFGQHRTLHKKRIRQNVWSSRAIRFTELRDTAMFKKGAKRFCGERKKSTVSTKPRTALPTGYGGHFHVQNYPHSTGSRGRGRRRSTINDEGVGPRFSASRAEAEFLTSKNFTSDGRPLSTCDLVAASKRASSCSDERVSVTRGEAVSNNVHQFSSTTEFSQGQATPVVPLEVKRLIACHNTGETVLHKAARLGYPDIVLWCCQSRYIDIETTDNAGYTPLHESCIGSKVCIARHLLHYGADINVASGVDGRRPIHEAVDSDSLEMVRLLLSAGADINLTTYSGKTVQDLAKSPEMKGFIKAYLDDLNDLKDEDKEVVWDLAPVWNGVSDECGMDLLSDLPTCEPKSEEFYVECSTRPL